jgi:hypothetical protein
LLLAEVEDVAVGLGRVQDPVGAGEGLDQAVVLEVLVDVERVEVLVRVVVRLEVLPAVRI